MRLEHGEDLAGHVGRKVNERTRIGQSPFGMGAGHDENAAIRATGGEMADQFGFFAAHDIGQARVRIARRASDEMHNPALFRREPGQHRRQIASLEGERQIGRLAPAVAAGDHARGDNREIGRIGEPAPDRRLENAVEIAIRHGQDAGLLVDVIDNRPVRGKRPGAKTRGAPVNGNQVGHDFDSSCNVGRRTLRRSGRKGPDDGLLEQVTFRRNQATCSKFLFCRASEPENRFTLFLDTL